MDHMSRTQRGFKLSVQQIAQTCHQANKAICQAAGDNSQSDWELAEEWQRQSAIDGVIFHLDNSKATASSGHENWMADKVADGWKYGEVKDADAKTHPCIVPFDELSFDQRVKDHVFKALVLRLGGM